MHKCARTCKHAAPCSSARVHLPTCVNARAYTWYMASSARAVPMNRSTQEYACLRSTRISTQHMQACADSHYAVTRRRVDASTRRGAHTCANKHVSAGSIVHKNPPPPANERQCAGASLHPCISSCVRACDCADVHAATRTRRCMGARTK